MYLNDHRYLFRSEVFIGFCDFELFCLQGGHREILSGIYSKNRKKLVVNGQTLENFLIEGGDKF